MAAAVESVDGRQQVCRSMIAMFCLDAVPCCHVHRLQVSIAILACLHTLRFYAVSVPPGSSLFAHMHI